MTHDQSHKDRHEQDGDDELPIENLPTTNTLSNMVLQPDGSNGLEWNTLSSTSALHGEIGVLAHDWVRNGDGKFTYYVYESDGRVTHAHYQAGNPPRNNQEGFLFVSVVLPDDFASFQKIIIETYRDGTPDTFTFTMSKGGVVDSNINDANVNPTNNQSFETTEFPSSDGGYSAGDTILFKVKSIVDDEVYAEVSSLRLIYNRS